MEEAAAPTTLRRKGPEWGKLSIVAGDDDINDWDQALFKISRIILLGGSDGQVIILDETRLIDFLALETVNEVLAEAEVPADTYSKVRFEVDSIRLVKLIDPDNPEMGIEEFVNVRQSSHKVDVNPRGQFEVGEDENLVIEIDIDLDRSLKAHPNRQRDLEIPASNLCHGADRRQTRGAGPRVRQRHPTAGRRE